MHKSKLLYPLLLLSILLLVWWFFATVYKLSPIFLPSPQSTLAALLELIVTGDFWLDLASSWYRVILGFAISLVIAYPLSMLSIRQPALKETIFYFVEFFRYLPVPVFIPITILWFGIDDGSKIVIIVLGTFAQMIPMFYDSAERVQKQYTSFNFALKWDSSRYIRQVIIPGSAPQVLDNCRICLGWAWTYLIVAEIVGADHGLGYAMIRAQRYLATDKIFAYILVIGLIGILTDRTLLLLRKRRYPWNNS